MRKTARDNAVGIIIGVIAALIVSMVTVFTADLTHLEGVMVFALCLVVCGLVLPVIAVASQPAGRIAFPQNESTVNREEVVTGVIRGLRSDTRAWLIVWPATERAYWPQRELGSGRRVKFSSKAYFGQIGTTNSGERFILMLVQADRMACAQFRAFKTAQHSGMRDLPRGVKELDQVTVTRR